jgi:hypothetical protein
MMMSPPHIAIMPAPLDADWLARNQWNVLRRMQRCLQTDAATRTAGVVSSYALPVTEAADRLART